MIETILIATIPTVVLSTISVWVTKISERKKYLAETVSVEQTNLRSQMDTYEVFLNNTNERVSKVISESRLEREQYLEREKEYTVQINELKKNMNKMEAEVQQLMLKVCTDSKCMDRKFLERKDYE